LRGPTVSLRRFVQSKCHPLLLCTRINSVFTVRLNVYQCFLYAAVKFCAYLKALKPNVKVIGVEPTGANAMTQASRTLLVCAILMLSIIMI
jgi:hypothetical protein